MNTSDSTYLYVIWSEICMTKFFILLYSGFKYPQRTRVIHYRTVENERDCQLVPHQDQILYRLLLLDQHQNIAYHTPIVKL